MRALTRIIAEGDIDALLLHANDPALQEYARTWVTTSVGAQYGIATNPGRQSGGIDAWF